MKRDSFSVLFFLRKNQILRNGEAAVCMRITVNSGREEVRIKKSINPAQWNQAKECSRARDKKSRDINDYIENARIRLSLIFQELEQSGKTVTAKLIKERFFGMDEENRKTLLTIFKDHNEQCRKLVGIDYVDITIRRYECCARYLEELIKEKYRQDDLMLKEVDAEFIRNFEVYMKTERKCQQNTVIRYMKCFKKVINLAIANEWISKNPFAGIKFHEVQVNREFLSMEEINIIISKNFKIERLNVTRDIFIFQCFTGLAYIDVYNLRKQHLVQDNNGAMWIRKTREKTDNMCNIPLLSIPIQILEKYSNNPYCIEKGVLLPVLSNQKMNSYLKEVADFCGITKNLTTHTARYSFASIIALGNNVSLPNVSKMLGHSNTRMTQHYAKVMDSSILREMENVEKNLKLQNI